MVDEKFSASSFAGCQLDSQQARDLSDALAKEIENEMHQVIYNHFLKIINRLNEMGHSLKVHHPPVPGEISYRDDWNDESGYHCRLRVAIDTTVSTGYAHLLTEDEIIEKIYNM
jgi:hypothetical protein